MENDEVNLIAPIQQIEIKMPNNYVHSVRFNNTISEGLKNKILAINSIFFDNELLKEIFIINVVSEDIKNKRNEYFVPNLVLLSYMSIQDVIFIIHKTLNLNNINIFLSHSIHSYAYPFIILCDLKKYNFSDSIKFLIKEDQKNISRVSAQNFMMKYKTLLEMSYKIDDRYKNIKIDYLKLYYKVKNNNRDTGELSKSVIEHLSNRFLQLTTEDINFNIVYLGFSNKDKYGYGQFFTSTYMGIDKEIPNMLNSLIIGTCAKIEINDKKSNSPKIFSIICIMLTFINTIEVTIQPYDEITFLNISLYRDELIKQVEEYVIKLFKLVHIDLSLKFLNSRMFLSFEKQQKNATFYITNSINSLERIKLFTVKNYTTKTSINTIGFKSYIEKEDLEYLQNVHTLIEQLQNFQYIKYILPELLITVSEQKIEFKIHGIDSLLDLKLNLLFILNAISNANLINIEQNDTQLADFIKKTPEEKTEIIKGLKDKYETLIDQKYNIGVNLQKELVLFSKNISDKGEELPYTKIIQNNDSRIALISKQDYDILRYYIFSDDNTLKLHKDSILSIPNQINKTIPIYYFCPKDDFSHIAFKNLLTDYCIPKCVAIKENDKIKNICYSKLNISAKDNNLISSPPRYITSFNFTDKSTTIAYMLPDKLKILFPGKLYYYSDRIVSNYRILITIKEFDYTVNFGSGNFIYVRYKNYYFVLKNDDDKEITYDEVAENIHYKEFFHYMTLLKFSNNIKKFIRFLVTIVEKAIPSEIYEMMTTNITQKSDTIDKLIKYCKEQNIELYANLIIQKLKDGTTRKFYTNITETFIDKISNDLYTRESETLSYTFFNRIDHYVVNVSDNCLYAIIKDDSTFHVNYEPLPPQIENNIIYNIFDKNDKKYYSNNFNIEEDLINSLILEYKREGTYVEKEMINNYNINLKFNALCSENYENILVSYNVLNDWGWRMSTNS